METKKIPLYGFLKFIAVASVYFLSCTAIFAAYDDKDDFNDKYTRASKALVYGQKQKMKVITSAPLNVNKMKDEIMESYSQIESYKIQHALAAGSIDKKTAKRLKWLKHEIKEEQEEFMEKYEKYVKRISKEEDEVRVNRLKKLEQKMSKYYDKFFRHFKEFMNLAH